MAMLYVFPCFVVVGVYFDSFMFFPIVINKFIVPSCIKGTMSPQAHVRVDERHFEIVGPTFSKTVGEFAEEAVFIGLICVHRRKVC